MTRIKIRTTTEDTTETRAFKLGYQKGFREAESVTLERIQRKNIDPLNEKLCQAEKDLYYYKNELNIAQTKIKYLEKEKAKKYYEHTPESKLQPFLGFDKAISKAYSGTMSLNNTNVTDFSSLERRIASRFAESVDEQILQGLSID